MNKEKRILAGLTLAFAVLIFAALMLLGSATEQRKTAAWVAHTRDVLEKMNELVTCLSDAENGRRGYVLSGEDRYLGHHTNRVGRAEAALRELRELTRENPRQSLACDQLEEMIARRLAIFTNSIRARQENGLDVPAQTAFMEQGQQAMDPIRRLVARWVSEETARLKEQQGSQDENVKGTEGFAVLVSLFGLTLFAVQLVLFLRANRQRRRAEEALQQTNLQLEQRVAGRTAELKQALEARQKGEAFLAEAQEIAHAGSWELEPSGPAGGGRLHWSRETYRILGMVPGERAPGSDLFYSLVHPEDRPRVREAFANALAGRSSYHCEHRIVLPDGTLRAVQQRANVIRDPATGRPVRVLGIIQDITERKRAEEEIRTLNTTLERRVAERTAQLEQVNKELEAFSYSVSHDLRAPLRHIGGYVEMLQSELGPTVNEKGRRFLDVISDSAKRMGALIDDLLSFSRMGRADLSRRLVNVDRVIDEVRHEMQRDVEGRNIQWKIEPMPQAFADPAMLKQVWANLLSNAVKYTRHRDPAEIGIGCRESETEHEFYVQDNGAGFDMNYAHKLFGVFQRLHQNEEFEGTGIGLANVRRIVARHGGRTWAEGKPDGGATFSFTLPKLKSGSPT